MKFLDKIKTNLKEDILEVLNSNDFEDEKMWNFDSVTLTQYPTSQDFVNLIFKVNDYEISLYVTLNEQNELVFSGNHSDSFNNPDKNNFTLFIYMNILSFVLEDIFFSGSYNINKIE